MTECHACGVPLPPNAKFCNECGARVAGPQAAEFKQVTVLFADVVHSMDIAAAVGPERLREIMTALATCATTVIARHGGTVDKFTGDGIMAVFGAPKALEDHALRACLAALAIQDEVSALADEVHRVNGVTLQVRIGLNSGEVIAGQIGPSGLGYTAIGEQVGLAQRMESAAPPGGVMLSASTARLVDESAILGPPELCHIKGIDHPVPARPLLAVSQRREQSGVGDSTLFGRDWEIAAVGGLLERATHGRGGVVGVVGSPGIGKTRVAREIAAMASARGVDVFWTFCESHTSDIPFHVLTRLLRQASGIADIDGPDARDTLRAAMPGADVHDVQLLFELMGIADPQLPASDVNADARRRRLTSLINAATLERTEPALYIIEDAHWIDEVSESMLVDFFTVIPQTPSMVLITYRPEYQGALTRMTGAQTIALAPLADSETSALVSDALGTDPSVRGLAQTIVNRAGGNPFFAAEMVRDLAERGVLAGSRGAYSCQTDTGELSIPPTLQATIGARIDRLDIRAKRTLNAAAVIGSRFTSDQLAALGIEPVLDELVETGLVDQVGFTPLSEYAFHHPLIRSVAYEMQLRADRADLHRKLADAIQKSNPSTVDEEAALIAEHLEAAGDAFAAYEWHMRAAAWSFNRDIAAARVSWERASQIADQLPEGGQDGIRLRVAPRTMLCGTAWRGSVMDTSRHYQELQEMCAAAGDTSSLALGAIGVMANHQMHDRVSEAVAMASEQVALLDAIEDRDVKLSVLLSAMLTKTNCPDWDEIHEFAGQFIEWADGDAGRGGLSVGSPLAVALVLRGYARWSLGRPGWRADLDEATELSRGDVLTHAMVLGFAHGAAILHGVVRADNAVLREFEEVLPIVERRGDDMGFGAVLQNLGIVLTHRDGHADQQRGMEALKQVRTMCFEERYPKAERSAAKVLIARELARGGDHNGAISMMSEAIDHEVKSGHLTWIVFETEIFVDTLLERGSETDLFEAQRAVERLSRTRPTEDWVIRDVTLLRLNALLARARGDDETYAEFRDSYRVAVNELGFEGHMAKAAAMT